MEALHKLQQDSNTASVAEKWPSLYGVISVINNRIAPAHRDGNGLAPAFDLLVALGSYTTCTLDILDLGLKLNYFPGTAVFLCANVFQHEVTAWDQGDRGLYAHFLKRPVLELLKVQEPQWACISDYRDMYNLGNLL